MKNRILRTLAVLFPFAALPRAEAVQIMFSGVITEVSAFYDPASSYRPPMPNVSVGDAFTGIFSYSLNFPAQGIAAMSITVTSGNWQRAVMTTLPFAGSGYIFFETSGIGMGVSLIAPPGESSTATWGNFVERQFFGSNNSAGVWVRGTVADPNLNRELAGVNVPDAGSTTLMLGLSIAALLLHRRFMAL